MKLKLRVRVNDAPETNGEFIHFDNCSEVRIGKSIPFGHDYDGQPSPEYVTASLENRKSQGVKNPSTNKNFDHVHFMLRNRVMTAKRLKEHPEEGKIVYHINTIDWKDRITNQWHRLLYDTVVFLQNDQGDTLEKIEG